jgi:hypothetical protein
MRAPLYARNDISVNSHLPALIGHHRAPMAQARQIEKAGSGTRLFLLLGCGGHRRLCRGKAGVAACRAATLSRSAATCSRRVVVPPVPAGIRRPMMTFSLRPRRSSHLAADRSLGRVRGWSPGTTPPR